MSGPGDPSELTPRERAERKRRLAEVFGDVLPEQTSDDVSPEDGSSSDAGEKWLKEQVPPHHG